MPKLHKDNAKLQKFVYTLPQPGMQPDGNVKKRSGVRTRLNAINLVC